MNYWKFWIILQPINIMEKYAEELKFFEKYDMSEERKIKLIEDLYRLANILFDDFVENNWEISFLKDK